MAADEHERWQDDRMFGGGRLGVLLFCWLGWVFDFYDLILFSFLKGQVAQDLGLRLDGAVAWIEGWSLLATAVGGFAFGRIADRIGRRPAMVASIVVFSLGALATGGAQGFWSLLLARIVTGLGVGGEWGIGHAVVAEVWRGRARDRVHGILQAGSPVAMALAAAVACLWAPALGLGWRTVFCGSALLGGIALFGRWLMPTPVVVGGTPRLSALELFAPQHRRATWLLLAVLTLHMAGFWCVYAELPVRLMRLHGVPVNEVGWFQIEVNSVHVFADVLFGVLAARLGQVRVFVAFCLMFAVGQWLVLQALAGLRDDFARFTWAIAAMGLGAGTWSCFGALFGRYYPAALRATAAALCYSTARAVQLPLKPLIGEAFAASGSLEPALWAGIACALGAAVLVPMLPNVGATAITRTDRSTSSR